MTSTFINTLLPSTGVPSGTTRVRRGSLPPSPEIEGGAKGVPQPGKSQEHDEFVVLVPNRVDQSPVSLMQLVNLKSPDDYAYVGLCFLCFHRISEPFHVPCWRDQQVVGIKIRGVGMGLIVKVYVLN